MRTITAKVSNPDFLTAYKFFSSIGDVSKLAITDKKVKVSFSEKQKGASGNILMDFTKTDKIISFMKLYYHLSNYGSVSYYSLKDNVAIFRFSTLNETFKAYEDLKRYNQSGLLKISFVAQ